MEYIIFWSWGPVHQNLSKQICKSIANLHGKYIIISQCAQKSPSKFHLFTVAKVCQKRIHCKCLPKQFIKTNGVHEFLFDI